MDLTAHAGTPIQNPSPLLGSPERAACPRTLPPLGPGSLCRALSGPRAVWPAGLCHLFMFYFQSVWTDVVHKMQSK